jgi:GTP-binding protein
MIVANKWDLRPPGLKTSAFVAYLRKTLGGFAYAPVAFTSAKTGKGVDAVLTVAWRLHEQAATRVSTAEVNRAVQEAQRARAPRAWRGKVGTIYYGTQVETRPPTFVLFVNDPAQFEQGYLRYLENRFREYLPFPEVPIRLRLKARARPGGRRVVEEDAAEGDGVEVEGVDLDDGESEA